MPAHEGPIRALWRALRQDDGVRRRGGGRPAALAAARHPDREPSAAGAGAARQRDAHAAQTAALGRRRLASSCSGRGSTASRSACRRPSRARPPAERQDNYVTLLRERSARAFPTAHVAETLKTLPEWQSSTRVALPRHQPRLQPAHRRSQVQPRHGRRGHPAGLGPRRPAEPSSAPCSGSSRVAPRGKEDAVVSALLGNGYTSASGDQPPVPRDFRAQDRGGVRGRGDGGRRAPQRPVPGRPRRQRVRPACIPSLGGGIPRRGRRHLDHGRRATRPGRPSSATSTSAAASTAARSTARPPTWSSCSPGWTATSTDAKTAFERLNERRPDIQRIELSCENTNTVLPYVDLVNEILEVRVLNPAGADAERPRCRGPRPATSPELLANPEHLNPRGLRRAPGSGRVPAHAAVRPVGAARPRLLRAPRRAAART